MAIFLMHFLSVFNKNSSLLLLWLRMEDFDLKTAVFMATAAFLVVVSLTLILVLYMRRAVVSAQDSRIEQLRFKYQYLIYDALVESQLEDSTPAQRLIIEKLKKEVAKSNTHKQTLINLMIDLKKNFSGESEQQFVQLYQALGLQQYSTLKLSDYQWDIQAEGIRELTEMDYENPDTRLAIGRLRAARNRTVAQEAQIASVRLETASLSFLDEIKGSLTEWQQISLHHFLLKADRRNVPDFTRWLTSSNESVVVFSLRMLADFEVREAETEVLRCLSYPSLRIREEAIQTLVRFEAKKTLPQLIEACQNCRPHTYLQLIKAVGSWGNSEHIPLLLPLTTHTSANVCETARHVISKLQQSTRKADTRPEATSKSI